MYPIMYFIYRSVTIGMDGCTREYSELHTPYNLAFRYAFRLYIVVYLFICMLFAYPCLFMHLELYLRTTRLYVHLNICVCMHMNKCMYIYTVSTDIFILSDYTCLHSICVLLYIYIYIYVIYIYVMLYILYIYVIYM